MVTKSLNIETASRHSNIYLLPPARRALLHRLGELESVPGHLLFLLPGAFRTLDRLLPFALLVGGLIDRTRHVELGHVCEHELLGFLQLLAGNTVAVHGVMGALRVARRLLDDDQLWLVFAGLLAHLESTRGALDWSLGPLLDRAIDVLLHELRLARVQGLVESHGFVDGVDEFLPECATRCNKCH